MPSRERLEHIKKSRAMAEYVEYARAVDEIRSIKPPAKRALARLDQQSVPPEIERVAVSGSSDPGVLGELDVNEALDPMAEVAERNKNIAPILSRRFRKTPWIVSCLQQEDGVRVLLATFTGIARILDAFVANNAKQRPAPFAHGYLAGFLPTPATRIQVDEKGRSHVEQFHPDVAKLRGEFLGTLDNLDTTLIRRCAHKNCNALFWAARKDQSCCSSLHAKRWRSLQSFFNNQQSSPRTSVRPKVSTR